MDNRGALGLRWVAVVLGTWLGPIWGLASESVATEAVRPNIVVLMADDLGYGDLGCYGGKLKSPAIDRLAAEGVRFTDFHSSGPICTPTRCALMTGRYPQRSGLALLAHENNGLSPSELTLPEVLKPQGYTSALFGKWHLGVDEKYNPLNQGFDEFRGFVGGASNYMTQTIGTGGDWWVGRERSSETGYTTTLFADYAIDFIKRQSGPFFLYVAFNAVHTPIQDPASGRTIKTPETYAKMLAKMDESVDRIMAALKSREAADTTLVIFMSDNGAPPTTPGASNQPLNGCKGTLWEGGHRVPAIVWWPSRLTPRVCDQAVITMDVLPTLAELTGATIPPDHAADGVSWCSLLFENRPLAERALFWTRSLSTFAMREGPWKLIVQGPAMQLYHLSDDLAEQHDVAAEQPERVSRMRAALDQWRKEVGTGKPLLETEPASESDE